MEPEGSLPYSQAPATCPYPEPTPSSPHNSFPLPEGRYMYYINLLILFRIRSSSLNSGRNRSLYLFIRRVTKQIVVIVQAHNFVTHTQHPVVKVNSICSGNYWGSSVWISTQQVNYVSYYLHSLNTGEKWV